MTVKRIIDTHVHLWDLEANNYPWLKTPFEHETFHGDISAIRRNYLLEDFCADTSGLPVVGLVHLQAEIDRSDPVRETAWLQAIADQHRMPQAIVGFAALHDPQVERVLESHAAFANHRGIRHIISWHEDPFYRQCDRADYLMADDWRRGYALLRKFNMSFDLQIYPSQMFDAAQLAKTFPDTLLVLEHCGFPYSTDREIMEEWRKGMRTLAAVPNTAIKISALVMFYHKWNRDVLISFIREAIEIFGPHRSMFASDFPVDGIYISYMEWVSIFSEAISDLSGSEIDSVFFANAARSYRIAVDFR